MLLNLAAIDAALMDVATIAGFAVLALASFFVFNTLLGGRARPIAASGDTGIALTDLKKAGPLKRAMAGAWWQPAQEIEGIRADLIRAGHYGPSALEDYLSTRNFCVWLILFSMTALAIVANPASPWPIRLLIIGAIAAGLCLALPRFVLARQARARVARIERGLPDALDIIQMCLTGGLPLSDSLSRVADEIRWTHPDIAVEFEIIRRQADAGSMAKALRNFADRIDAPDVRALSALVTQTERMGTEVSVAIAEFGDRMRLSFRQRAEERASRASVLLLFPVILCLVPPLLIAIAGPPILKLRNFLIEANEPGGALDPSGVADRGLQANPRQNQQRPNTPQ